MVFKNMKTFENNRSYGIQCKTRLVRRVTKYVLSLMIFFLNIYVKHVFYHNKKYVLSFMIFLCDILYVLRSVYLYNTYNIRGTHTCYLSDLKL